jgi:hypothetical protein
MCAYARMHSIVRVCAALHSTFGRAHFGQCRAQETHHFDFSRHTQRNRAHSSGAMRQPNRCKVLGGMPRSRLRAGVSTRSMRLVFARRRRGRREKSTARALTNHRVARFHRLSATSTASIPLARTAVMPTCNLNASTCTLTKLLEVR